MKKLLLTAFFWALALAAPAQVLNPAKWKGNTSVAAAKVGDVVELVFSATIEADWYMYSNDFDPDLGPNLTTFTFKPDPSYQLVGKPLAVGAKKKFDKIWEGDVTYFTKTAEFRQKVKIVKELLKVEATATYQLCSDVTGQCLPPTDADLSFALRATPIEAATKDSTKATEIKAQPTNEAKVEPTVTKIEDLPLAKDTSSTSLGDSAKKTEQVAPTNSSPEPAPGEDDPAGEAGGSLIGFFLFAFLSGVAALITPCVFPMIPMTVTFFMKNSESRAQAVTKGIVYGLSIITIFVLIGTVFSFLFGADAANILATHWLPNMFFFIVFIVFALSFFGMFEIVLPSSLANKLDQKADQGGYTGVFFMAFTLAVVSFSCTGPIAGSVLVQSANGEFTRPIIGMLGFSLAFALPFSLFAIFPNWMQTLPKSGGWLNSVKVVLGFIELALALKFLSIVDQVYHWGILDRHIYIAFWAAITLFMGLYLLGKIRLPHDSPVEKVGVGRMLLAVLAFTFLIYLLPGMFGAPLKALAGYLPPQSTHDFDVINLVKQSVQSGTNQGATATRPTSLAKYGDRFHLPHGLTGYFDYQEGLAAAKQAGKPVFIDFTGHGCVNCREMEANVWSDPAVLQRLQNDYVIIALYVDDPLELPEKDWVTSAYDGKLKKSIGKINADFQISKFNNNAQPFYVLLDHEGKLLVNPKAYDLKVENFVQFLDRGLNSFKTKQNSLVKK